MTKLEYVKYHIIILFRSSYLWLIINSLPYTAMMTSFLSRKSSNTVDDEASQIFLLSLLPFFSLLHTGTNMFAHFFSFFSFFHIVPYNVFKKYLCLILPTSALTISFAINTSIFLLANSQYSFKYKILYGVCLFMGGIIAILLCIKASIDTPILAKMNVFSFTFRTSETSIAMLFMGKIACAIGVVQVSFFLLAHSNFALWVTIMLILSISALLYLDKQIQRMPMQVHHNRFNILGKIS